MPILAALRAYRSQLQDQLELVDEAIENHLRLADQAGASEGGALLDGQLRSVSSVSQMPQAVPDRGKTARVRGVLAAVREIVEEFSGPFDKNDIRAKLRARDSHLADSVSPANLRNTLRILAKKGDIEVQIDATSRTCAKYVSKRTAA
jgi:hypothetical protein